MKIRNTMHQLINGDITHATYIEYTILGFEGETITYDRESYPIHIHNLMTQRTFTRYTFIHPIF